MKILTRQITLFCFLFFPLLLFAQVDSYKEVESLEDFEKWRNKVNIVRTESLDDAIQLYQTAGSYFLEKSDTLNAIYAIVELAELYGHEVRYNDAYDNLWNALLLADLAQAEAAKIKVYIQLGRYYSFYKRKEKALEYLQLALAVNKKLIEKGDLEEHTLRKSYYALCATYQDFNDHAKAKDYLDSCYNLVDTSEIGQEIAYLDFNAAIITRADGRYQESLNALFAIQPWFEQYRPGFLVLFFTQIGNNYLSLNNPEEGERYYRKALEVSKQYNSHLDYIPTVYNRLTNLYVEKGDHQKALASLKKEQELNTLFFDSRSENNHSLLEIRDDFRKEKEKQEKLLHKQRLADFEHEERVAFLKNILLAVTLVFLIFAGILYFNYIRNKHRTEKQLIRKKRELEIQQANELIELKNKELATSSLKLIEKDEVLATLKEKLTQGNGEIKAHELKKIVRTISNNYAQNWDEFETRFISVNKDFYKKLNEKFPKISRGDQKLIALVKLNLSSKEMAKLLGISIDSVNTNRYRLRKKLGLTRDISLTEFVAKL